MKRQCELHRRSVLRSVTGSLLLPSLVSVTGSSSLRGSDSVLTAPPGDSGDTEKHPVQRFVAIANLLGFQQKHWFPEQTGREYEQTRLLEPLVSQRDRFTIYRGLDHGLKGGHFAVHTFLSGVLHHEAKNRKDRNVTLDQHLAETIGGDTRYPSIAVGSEGGIHGGCQLSWTRSGVRVPPITEPEALFNQLFINDPAETLNRRTLNSNLQTSILDSVMEEAGDLAKRVNQEDRSKLDEYFSSVRDVERKIQLRKRWADQPKPDSPLQKPVNRNTVEDLPVLYELIAIALQTKSTRIATLEIGGSFLPQNLGIDKSYHSLSHHGNDEATVETLVKLETYQIEQFSKFLGRLASMKDGERSLLDTTAVIFGSGMGNGSSHTNSDLPIVLAGAGYQTGDYRVSPARGINKVPLCNLYVDIAQRAGLSQDQFGVSTGVYS
ncbi:DUF1552 domain-containing protein [Rhodopirellula sp.]|nr:DUF1552 domain-containing protein [Rhodopirellula sp.]MDB4678901.1 DUF1552 domain-containing protein [Rhodopirellula sp.]